MPRATLDPLRLSRPGAAPSLVTPQQIGADTSHKEIEVKILEVERGRLEGILLSLGAKKVFDSEMTALFFAPRAGSAVQPSGVLRLRQEADQAFLVLKQPATYQGAKIREELQVQVSDFFTARQILESLGFQATAQVRKHRVQYDLGCVSFAFDQYLDDLAHIPEFLEIEGPSLGLVLRHAALLGYKPDSCLPWGMAHLIAHYAPQAQR
ncbi:MAG: class IV adenylate cyclase [candidate division WOR-3 bacterium]